MADCVSMGAGICPAGKLSHLMEPDCCCPIVTTCTEMYQPCIKDGNEGYCSNLPSSSSLECVTE